MNIYKKQYVISSRQLVLGDMTEFALNGAFLYVDTELNCRKLFTKDDKTVYLLGHTFCMDKRDKSVEDDIQSIELCNLHKVSLNWTGRWVAVTQVGLINDGAGLMSAFYHQDENSWIVCSSLAVMSQISKKPILREVESSGLTYQFMPGTLVDGVKALLCAQKLGWGDGALKVENISKFHIDKNLTTEQKSEYISNMLQNAIWNINKYSGKDIVMALTAGKDSRLVLAAALASGVPFEAYTANYSDISSCDKKLPARMARDFGFKHSLVKPKKTDLKKKADYLEFCGHNSNGADLLFYSNGQFDRFGKNDIIIRSGIFEAAQHFSRSITDGNSLDALKKGYRKYYFRDMNQWQDKALTEWIEYAEKNPIKDVDVRDRFYVEQRVNGWVAAIEQSLDINDFVSIQIANCANLISVLLSATEEERKTLALSFDPIRLMAPGLLKYPVNKRTFFDTLRIYRNGIKKRVRKLLKIKI